MRITLINISRNGNPAKLAERLDQVMRTTSTSYEWDIHAHRCACVCPLKRRISNDLSDCGRTSVGLILKTLFKVPAILRHCGGSVLGRAVCGKAPSEMGYQVAALRVIVPLCGRLLLGCGLNTSVCVYF